MGFREAREEEMVKGEYLSGPTARGYARALGAGQGEQLARDKDSVKVHLLSECPDDALDELGALYAIERFNDESHDAYRARLGEAWETWRWAGTKKAIIDSLHAFGIADVAVYEWWQGHFSQSYYPSSFWIIIGPDMPFSPLLGGFTQSPNTTGGSTATPAQVRSVVRQVLKWKEAFSYPVKVILRFQGAILSGINSIPPFLVPANGGDYTTWDLGKIMGINEFTAPYQPGGYYTY